MGNVLKVVKICAPIVIEIITVIVDSRKGR